MKKLVAGLAVIAFGLGTLACGGAADKAKDASDASGDKPAKGKSLEKFEGDNMEKADEEE